MFRHSSMPTFHTRRSQIILTRGNSKWESFLEKMYLQHSAKGSTWEQHKYIKRINGTYYYPDSYEGGRHLPDGEKNKGLEAVEIESLEEGDIQKLADEVIRGNYGNGQERKDALGAHYQQVQDRVNQIVKNNGSKKMSEVSSLVKEEGKALVSESLKKVGSTNTKGIDLETVYSVYKNRSSNKVVRSGRSSTTKKETRSNRKQTITKR